MKLNILSLLCGLVIATASMFLMSCEGEQGPPGPPGDAVNLEGFAPGIKCATCHEHDSDTTFNIAGRRFQWAQSKHANGGDSERNSNSCSGCHTTEGFVNAMNGLSSGDQPVPSPPGCFACHSPHARGDFSLRKVDPVTLASQIEGVPDASFDYGKGNLCAQCHKPRSMSPKMNASAPGDSMVITTTRWYPHYGVQSQMLMGEGGFEFPDFMYTGNSYHATAATIKQEGCVTCHMAEQVYPPALGTGKAGGHTMNIHYVANGVDTPLLTGCKQSGCHATITDTDFPGSTTAPLGAQTVIKANLDTLGTLLEQRGWLNVATTQVRLTGGKLVIKPAIKAGALYNYFFIEHDLSWGAHNTKYALEIVRSSIAELRKP